MSSRSNKSSKKTSRSNSEKASLLENFEKYAFEVPLQSSPLQITDHSQVMLSTNRFIATRVTRDYYNAFVLLSPDIQTDQFIVVQVLETDPTLIGGLRLYLNEHSYHPTKLIYADSKCTPGDYLIFWLSECGKLNIMKNNEKEPKYDYLPREHRRKFQLLSDMYGSVVKLRVFVGDRKKSEPFLTTPSVNNHSMSAAPSNSSTNQLECNTAHCLSSIRASPSDNAKAFLIFELRGNEIIPTGVKFSQNLLTANSACAVVPSNNNLEMTSSEDSSSHHVITSSIGRESETTTENKLCKICIETEVNTVIIPCGHMCLCYECAERIRLRFSNTCPICRSDIKQTQKVFLS